jgi:hypothetical protein
MKNRILHLFNIRTNEAWLVTNLFWFQFFQGAGIAIFNIIAFALFLQKFDVKELTKVYVFSAILLWVAGYVYSKFEHALSVKRLALGVILFMAASVLAFRLELFYSDNAWVLFVMFSWYYVIYLLANLEFWGIAALLFDIRQSKRLFGMIGAGDIPAKLIGYSAVPVLVKFYSSEDLLLLSFALILISLIFYYRLNKAGKLDLHVEHAHKEHRSTTDIKDIVKGFFGNRMIALVAGLSFIVVTVVTIVSFSFYAEIKHEAHSDVQLASFIGIFYATGRGLAILIRLVLTGRITNLLGIKGSLLISPVILFLFLVEIIAVPLITDNHHLIVYSFGLMAIITEVLKTSLQDPVFLSLMQPLSSHMRLKGHTIVKGVMDPFALAFTGFMLYTLLKISGKVDLVLLSYMVFSFLIVWVIMILVVDKEYVRTLLKALNKRYSVGQELNLSDEKTKSVLTEKIKSGERGEAIYILNILDKHYSHDKEELVTAALQHPLPEVRLEALKMAERKKITAALPYINNIIETKSHPEILPECVKAKCMLMPDEIENMDVFIEDGNPRLMKAAIIGLMTSGGINAVVTAGQKLLALISSEQHHERVIAAEIIGELGITSFYKPLTTLLNDTHDDVVKAAITGAGKVKNEKLITTLLSYYTGRRHTKIAVEALRDSGNAALKGIENALHHLPLTRQEQSKLISVCGRIGTAEATEVLEKLVWRLPYLRSDLFRALHQCEFKLQPEHKEKHHHLMHQHIHSSIHIAFMIRELQGNKTAKILAEALELEMNELRDSLLLLFSFSFDKEKMQKAKIGFQLKKKESMANALEIIEIEVPKDISLKFNRLFEPGTIEDKCNSLRGDFKETVSYEQIIQAVLSDTEHHFHRWTKAAALHSLIFYKGEKKKEWLQKAVRDTDFLINETAGKILAEMV